MSAIRTQMLGNYPKENILHIEHGESLKSSSQLLPCREITVCSRIHAKQIIRYGQNIGFLGIKPGVT